MKVIENQNMRRELLEVLACPICKGKLRYMESTQELICNYDKLSFPINKGIPVMIEEQARRVV